MKRFINSLFFKMTAFAALGIVSGYVLMQLAFPREPVVVTGDYRSYSNASTAVVIVYSRESCPYCAKTKQHLTQKGAQFELRDIDHSSLFRAQFEQLKGKQLPLILIGNRRINGYYPDEIDLALAAQPQTTRSEIATL